MTQEEYVSYDTAKLLNEKGFNDNDITRKCYPVFEGKEYKYDILCPTQQVAMRWLREEHDLHICLQPQSWINPEETEHITGWAWSIFKGKPFYCLYAHMYREKTYEEAAEKAIQFCLKYLIIENDGEISHESDRIKGVDETGTGL